MITDMLQYRGFQILGDASQQFQPVDAICQFKYKDYLVSVSTAGLSKGACQTEVAVFFGVNFTTEVGKHFHTVEEAIEFINKLPVKKVFSKEEFLTNSEQAKKAIEQGSSIKGVLTTEEQEQLMSHIKESNYANHGEIRSFGDDKVFWFTDDPNMGVGILPKNFRLCYMICPHRLYTGDSPTDGLVQNTQDYIKVYRDGMRQINTIDELVEYLNTNYA